MGKQTAMKIQNKVTPWIQHLEQILKLSIERQHNETSQLYKYIDDSIAHATSEVVKRITDLKENTDESLKALEESMKENLNSLKTITDDNNEKIIENTVNSNNSALALSLDWLSKRMDATEDILTSRVGVCGVSPDRREPGVVGYDRILHHTEGDKMIRLAGKNLSVSDSSTRHGASSGCLWAAAENTQSVWGWSRGSSTGSSPSASHRTFSPST